VDGDPGLGLILEHGDGRFISGGPGSA
jgi:hypothetical protein